MAIIVQITSGPFSGRKTYLRSGQELRVGRTEWADFSVPHDSNMSEVHFALQYDAYTCRLRDLNGSGGTLLNGKKVTDAVVQHGDKITAIQTQFVIQIEGTVKEVMTGGLFKIESEKGQQFTAKISGRMRRYHIKVIPGDRVTVAVSPYDPTHGLIVYRNT